MPDDPPGWVPRPDPTILTTEQLHREIANLRELIEAQVEANHVKLQAVRELLEARISKQEALGAQRYQLARETIESRFEDHVTSALERFETVRREFDILLAAQREAVSKTETTTETAISGIRQIITSSTDGLETEIRALEKRFDREEGKGQGLTQSWSVAIVVITVAINLVGLYLLFQSAP